MQASIPKDWRKVKLGDYLTVLTDYHANGSYEKLKANVELLDTPNYAVMIRTKNFEQNDFQDDLKYITKTAYEFLAKSKVKPKDILMNKIANAGSIYCMPDLKRSVSLAMNLFLLRTKEEEAHQKYVFYYLKSNEAYIKSFATGTAATTITKQAVREIEILLPPLSEQKAIAHILSSFDDKIELNRQMNETLEAMARAIFKSWFVDFDPVSAKRSGRQPAGMDTATADLFPDEFEESSLGLIPKGWRVGKLGDIAENPRRGVKPENITPNTPYIGLEHMPKRSISLSDWGSVEDINSNKYQFYQGEILFGKLRPYFHKVGVAALDGICSTDILVITPKLQEWFSFVLSIVSSDEFINYTNITSTGTRMPRTNWNDMSKYEIIIPSIEIVKTFNYQLVPFVNKIKSHIFESHILATLGDTLLPKLMSGEIRVKEAEKIINDKL